MACDTSEKIRSSAATYPRSHSDVGDVVSVLAAGQVACALLRFFMAFISSIVKMGDGKQMRWHRSGSASSKFRTNVTLEGESRPMAILSRRGSMGGFVTCKVWNLPIAVR